NDVQFLGRSLTDIGQQWNNAKGQGAGAHLGALFGGVNKKPELFEAVDKTIYDKAFEGFDEAFKGGSAGMAKFGDTLIKSDKPINPYFAMLIVSEDTWDGYNMFFG
ncbi:MAG: hypothetical protein RSC60_06385, partial [Christensenellaceae bacterium]